MTVILGLSLLALCCRKKDHVLAVTAGPEFNGTVVRVDGHQVGVLAPPPTLDLFPFNQVSSLSDHHWATLSLNISEVPFRVGAEHHLEVDPPHGPPRSVDFALSNLDDVQFLNCSFGRRFSRSGRLGCLAYLRDGTMVLFPVEPTTPSVRGWAPTPSLQRTIPR